MEQIALAAVVAIITGVITGAFSSISTVSKLGVHIHYIKESIDNHDKRLRDVEKEQHKIAGTIGVNGPSNSINLKS